MKKSFLTYLFIATSLTVYAQVDFKLPVYVQGFNSPRETIVGDFDGNGLQDVLVSVEPASGLTVLYTQPSYEFISKSFKITSDNARASRIDVADLNEDGKDDFVVVDEAALTGGKVFVCISTGTDFNVTTLSDIDASSWKVVIVDFDNDGHEDVVLGGHYKWKFFEGDGAGNFAGGSTEGWPQREDTFSFDVLDVNGDDNLDFISIRYNQILTWVSTGSGYELNELVYEGYPVGATLADFSGDELPDLVIIHDTPTSTSVVKYFINNDNNSFSAPVTIPTSASELTAVDHFDYDNDGNEDILVANGTSGPSAYILRNDGNGAFESNPTDDLQSGRSVDAAFADLDNNGMPEMVSVSAQGIITCFNYDVSDYETIDWFPFGAACYDGDIYDLDNDGHYDIIGATSASSVAIWYGKGDLTFEDPVFYDYFGRVYDLAVADFNKDGVGDVAFAAYNPATTEAHTFVLQSIQAREYTTTGYSDERVNVLLAGDVDNDTFIDFVSDHQVFLNEGNWNFDITNHTAPTTAVSGALGHFNDDTFLDLALSTANKLYIGLNDQNGNFPTFTAVPQSDGIYHIKVVDLNGDSYTDLAGTITLANGDAAAIVFQSTGDGQFTQTRRTLDPEYAELSGVDVVDLDGDEIPDLVTGQQTDVGGVGIYLGTADGTFEDVSFFSSAKGTLDVLPASKFFLKDINKDSRLDAVIFSLHGPVAILEGNVIFEPTTPPKNITAVPTITAATITLEKGNGTGRLVLVRKRIFVEESHDPSAVPKDGTYYPASSLLGAGDQLGEDWVVMNGDETTVTVEGLLGGNRYYVFAWEYSANARNTIINYLPQFATVEFKTEPAPVVGLQDEVNNGFVVSPNPAEDVAMIRLPYVTEEEPALYNMLGVAFRVPTTRTQDSIQLNTSSLTPGLYLIRFQNVVLKLLKN